MRFVPEGLKTIAVIMVIPVLALLLWLISCSMVGIIAPFNMEPGFDEEGYSPYFGLNPPYPPQWSADGTNILLSPWETLLAKTRDNDNGTDIEYIKDVVHPSISPNGTRMAFATLRHGDNYEIGVSNLDGSNYRRLTKTKSSEANPVWSPDGSQIVFIFNRLVNEDFDDGGPAGLYILVSGRFGDIASG